MATGPDLFVVCKSCGSEVSPYVTECPYCGSRLRKRAPRLDKEPSKARRRREPTDRPRLGRIRRGEIPGIRPDVRPWATIVLVLASLALTLAWRAGAVDLTDLIVLGRPGDDWWRVLTAPFAYTGTGYPFAALTAIGLFGWLLERRHGPVPVVAIFLAAGALGMLAAASVEQDAIAMGGNGAALGLLCAWAIPDLKARRGGEDTDSDLLGVAVIAAVLLVLPLAAPDAHAVAGAVGGLVGLILGFPLARLDR